MHDWSLPHSVIMLWKVANFKTRYIDVSLKLLFDCCIEKYLKMGTQTCMPIIVARVLTNWLMSFIKYGQS